MSHAVVTGGYGLLGSWLVKGLLARGERVTVFGRSDGAGSALDLEGRLGEVEVAVGDVRDGRALAGVLSRDPVDVVFHLAGQAIVGAAWRAPAATFEINVGGTWTVLEACWAAGVGRVIVASSDTVYGQDAPAPCTEEVPLAAAYPYDASKAAADMIARSYWTSYGMAVAVTRFANVYGGGDMHASRLVPGSVWAALGGRRPVIRSDGTPERDFLYVEDAVAAYLAVDGALAAGKGEAAGEAFNAGGGATHRVLEIVRGVFEAAGVPFDPDIRGTGVPPGELARQGVDHGKLGRLTGWAPRFALGEGLGRTVEWYRRFAPAVPVPGAGGGARTAGRAV